MTEPARRSGGVSYPASIRPHIRIPARAAALGACLSLVALLLLLGSGSATAAEKPDPIKIGIPSGQSITLSLDPLGVVAQSGLTDTLLNKIPDFSLDLLIVKCGSSMTSDGSVWCGTKGKPAQTPTPTAGPTSGPTVAPPDPVPAPAEQPASGPPSGSAAPTASAAPAAAAARAEAAPPLRATRHGHHRATTRKTDHRVAPASPRSDGGADGGLSDHDLLILAAAALTMLGLVGRGGVARASMRTWRKRYPKAAAGTEGEVIAPDSEMYEFDPDAGGPGDRSRIWGVIAGWVVLDRLSRFAPFRLATKVPLVARVLADASYLRAIVGVGSMALVGIGFVLGLVSASNADGYPLAPSLGLCAALVVIACLDATAGLAGVAGFAVGLFVWGPGDLGLAASLRSFMGLAALWFAIPLIASSARPLRRSVESTALYAWDRLADGVIAALIGGWAVQDAVNGLAGLSGRQSPIAAHANALALWAIAGIALRVALEEMAARFFPERLKVVDTGLLPEPATGRNLLSACLRIAIFVFVAAAFLGNCWQLWVSGILFALPEVLDLVADRLPNRPSLYAVLPRGVTLVLFLLVVELLVTAFAGDTFDHHDLLRNGFVVLMVPECALTLLGLLGRDGPEPERRRLHEVLGTAVVVATIALVLAN